jgi:hypothetical protein
MQMPMPSTFDEIFSMNPGAFNQAQGQIDLGMNQEQEVLRKRQLENLFDAENNPLRIQNQRLSNEGLEAQIPGMRANSQSLGLKAEREQAGQQDAISLARKEFLSKASDLDLQMLANEGQRMAYSSDPAERKKGEMILSQHKDMIKERQSQASAERRTQVTANAGITREGMGIDAGKYKKKGGELKSVEDQVLSGKMGYEKAATLLSGAAGMMEIELMAMPDGEEKEALMQKVQNYRSLADDYNRKHIASKQAGAQAGLEGKPALAPLGIQPNAPKPVEGFQRPGATASKIPADLPQGTKINPDGSFTLPDGTRIRKKAQ